MADFLLSVGIDVGLSFNQMQKDISSLVSQLNGNPPKIKVGLEIDKAALSDFKNQISNLSKSSNGNDINVGIKNNTGAKSTAADMATIAKNARDAAAALKSTDTAFKNTSAGAKTLTVGTTEYYNALKQVNTLLNQVTNSQEKWTAAQGGKSSESYGKLELYANDLRTLQQQLQNGAISADDFKNRMASIRSGVTSASGAIKAAGEATQTWGDRIASLSAKFGTWLSITQVIMAGVKTIKAMTSNVIELNTAMTELKKVTDETDATYDKFLNRATTRAKDLGASLSDTVTATADFARLGYNIEEAEKLADSAIIYKNVGDGIEDISTASESIIATMQAFGVLPNEAMTIVDKFNEVGNKYAISSKGVGDALLRSAAAMHAAGNTIDETIALATAANTVVQDPDKVGTTLKTVSMFLRAAKTEAENAGESTDGMANSVSELRDEILALTGNKVDIQIDDNTFKSTYQILKELSSVWGELTDITQANILELVGGKRNSNVVAALLENFSVAEEALLTATNSEGSAVAENEKVLESIQGKLNVLKATFQDLSQSFISSELITTGVDALTKLLEALTAVSEIAGPLPTTIGAVTLALTALGKNFGAFSLSGNSLQVFGKSLKSVAKDFQYFKSQNQSTLGAGLNSLFSSKDAHMQSMISSKDLTALQNFSQAIDSGVPKVQAYKQHISGLGTATRQAAVQIASGSKSVDDFGKNAQSSGIKAKAAAVGVTALNIAMNMLITMGISAAIQGIITGFDNLVNHQEKAAEKTKEVAANSREVAQEQAEQTDTLTSLIAKYEELANSDVQDSSTREEILSIQNQIVSLVGDEAGGIDLVNGKLDEQLTKLKEIRDIEQDQTTSDYRKAYLDAAESAEKASHHEGTWVEDMFAGDNEILIDFWGEDKQRNQAIKMIDGLWKEKGYGQAYVEEHIYDLLGFVSDTYSKLQFDESLSLSERKKALDEAIALLENDKDTDWTDTQIWNELVSVRSELFGKDSEYTKQVETATAFLNKLADSEIKDGEDINSYQEYVDYRQKLIDQLTNDSTIKQAIQDGVLSNDQIETTIDGYLGTMEKYSKYYTKWQSEMKKSTDEYAKYIKDNYANSFTLDGSAGQLHQWEAATAEFNKWVDGLSDEDKEIVYGISLTKEEAELDLNNWKDELNAIKSDSSALDILKAKIQAVKDVAAGKINFDISSESSGIEELLSAKQSSISAIGLTDEAIKSITDRYSQLSSFDAAELFEKTANGIHLNSDALRELDAEYEAVRRTYLDTALEEQVERYNNLSEKIAECTDMQQRAKLIAEQNTLGDQIEQTATLAAQYDGLTSAYQKWMDAQSGGEEGDMYDNVADNLKNVKELYDKGLVGTNEFRAAAQMMTNYDISTWGIEDVMKAYENGYPLMTRYFTDGQEGCQRFLSDVSKLNSEWAHMNKDGSWEINFGEGNDQEIADKLGISVDAVQSILRKLSDYGFDIDLDSVFSDLGMLEDKLSSANEKLKELGYTEVDFNFNSTSIKDIDNQIKQATDVLNKFKNSDGSVNLSLDGVEEATTILATLISKKQELNAPAVMSVDTSHAQSDVENVIAALQTFQTDYNKLEIDTAIGVDTTEAQTSVDNALATISSASPEILASLGIDATSAETVAASIQALTPEVMVKAGIDASLIENYQATEHNAEGTVKWNNDTTLVDNWIAQTHNAPGTVNWGNNTDNVQKHFNATGTINWSGGSRARGTAFKNGSWGAKKSGIALGGELGRELVVRDGRFFTIGDDGAEFFRYKKDDIIFNADQTEQIFEQGKITSGNRRGRALAEGTAFSGGTGKFYQSGKVQKTAKSNKKTYKAKETIEASADVEVKDVKVDTKSAEEEMEDALKEIQEQIDDTIRNYEHQIFLLEKHNASDSEIIAVYSEMQKSVHDQAEAYRAKGLDENSEYIQKMQKQWWEYQENISDIIADGYENNRKQIENAADLANIQLENAVASRDYTAVSEYTSDIIGYYKQMQESVHDQAEYYRGLGYDDTSDEVSELSKLWWEYQENINDAVEAGYDALVEKARETIETIQEVYDTLKSAAEEFGETGKLPVDLLTSMSEIGIEYMSYLKDENGMLSINKDRIDAVIAARTKQLAVDTALSYVEKLRIALANNNTAELNKLISATESASNATWDLVYANLELLGLDDSQYKQALSNINRFRSLANNAINGIYSESSEERSKTLEDTKDALDTILDLTMDLVEYKVNQEIDALEEQKEKYREIIDLKKEALQTTKEENDYNKEVAKKVSEIAKLQSQINKLSLDDSREAQAEKAALEEELSELQTDLADYQSDYSIDKQTDMLDKMADAYDEEKDEEIESLKESISSTEKIYRLAIKRIKKDWDGLYKDILDWNYEAGSSVKSDIVNAWELAAQAVEKYGSYVKAVKKITSGEDDEALDLGASGSYGDPQAIKSQMRSNSLAWLTASDSEQKSLANKNSTLANQLSAIYDKGIERRSDGSWYLEGSSEPIYSIGKWEAVDYITNAMRDNSAKWNNASASERITLEKANEKMAGYIADLSGQNVWKDADGVWWIGNDNLYDSYGTYHTGGVVGDSTLKQDEVMAILKNGELVLDEQREKSLYKLVDFAQLLSERLGTVIDTTGLRSMFEGFSLLPSSKELLPTTHGGSSIEFSPKIEVNISHTGAMNDNDARRYGNIAAETALSNLREAFTKKGISNIGSAALK